MELPVVISVDNFKIIGILRVPLKFTKLVILIPSFTGNRLGPQRLFVEIARKLYGLNIATFCMDFPELDYSSGIDIYKKNIVIFNSKRYYFYIKQVIDYLKSNYEIEEILLLSISFGCMPVFNFAISNNIQRIILLSPDQVTNIPVKINIKNIKNYYYKLMDKNTWRKICTLNIDIKNVYRNIFPYHNKKVKLIFTESDYGKRTTRLKTFCIYGQNDKVQNKSHEFFQMKVRNNEIKSYDYKVIPNADHSFFGWEFKQGVLNDIANWI